jgi:hypothetical protein
VTAARRSRASAIVNPSISISFQTSHSTRNGFTRQLPSLADATVLERAPRTLVVLLRVAAKPIKLSFFGSMKIGGVSDPEHLDGGPWIASPLDLLATKLTTLHDRVEVRDYVDIEVLLRAGIPLDRGIAAAHALFGTALNPLDTAKR